MDETVQKSNERIHGHEIIFRNPSKHEHRYNCFTFKMRKEARYQVQIIEQLPITGTVLITELY